MAYSNNSPIKLTFDSDDNRINRYPSLVIDDSGRHIVFYEKTLYSGRLSDSRVTFTFGSFGISVEAGNGSIDGNPISWGLTTFSVPPSSFILVAVNMSGTVFITSDFAMHDVHDYILLAYVYSGTTSIARLDEIEKTGKYIYVRYQVDVGGTLDWDDHEYVLNTGERPTSHFDSVQNKIFLYYQKDSSAFSRVFDLANEPLTWSFIPNIYISYPDNTISKIYNPENTVDIFYSCGISGIDISTTDLFVIQSTALCYKLISGVYRPFIFIPYLSTTYFTYLKSNITYEIGYLSGTNFIVEDSFSINPSYNYTSARRWRRWLYTDGIKYIRVRCFTYYFIDEFITPVSGYQSTEIYPAFEKLSTSGIIITDDIRDYLVQSGIHCSGSKASYDKTFEYDQVYYTVDPDYPSIYNGAGDVATYDKLLEYDQIFNNADPDYSQVSSGAGYRAVCTIS